MKTEHQVQIEKEIDKLKVLRVEVKESTLSKATKEYLDQIINEKLVKLYRKI